MDDWNSDGKLDLAVGLITAGQVNIHNGDGTGTGTFATPVTTTLTASPSMLVSGDVNGV